MAKKLTHRIKETRESETRRLEKKHLKEAIERIEELEQHLHAATRLKGHNRTISIKPRSGTRTSEAVAIATASDWHVGQEVPLTMTNGMNEYNAKIARERATKFFQKIVRFTEKERQDVSIHDLLLFLGGDLIEGSLHLDTIMGSDISGAIRQAKEVQGLIQGGLDFLKAHGNYKRITVVCADGNHGRVTAKQHFHSRIGNSLENYMYANLAERNPDLTWIVEDSMLTYVPVYDFIIRFMHGDRISFGGVNGFYTYLHRRIHEWDSTIRADYTILGHLHQYTPTRRYLVNGSMVGYNPFAIALGARYEPPTQGFMLFDKKRGPTVHIPILF